jgi:hypothetical protein
MPELYSIDKRGRVTLIDPDKSPEWKTPAKKHLKK